MRAPTSRRRAGAGGAGRVVVVLGQALGASVRLHHAVAPSRHSSAQPGRVHPPTLLAPPRPAPAPPQGLNNLAVIYTQQGRAQEALQLLQAAVMAAPTYAEAHNNLGVLQVGARPPFPASRRLAPGCLLLLLCTGSRSWGVWRALSNSRQQAGPLHEQRRAVPPEPQCRPARPPALRPPPPARPPPAARPRLRSATWAPCTTRSPRTGAAWSWIRPTATRVGAEDGWMGGQWPAGWG